MQIRLTLKRKIIGLAVIAAVLPMLVTVILTILEKRTVTGQVRQEIDQLTRANLAQITRDVYGLCRLTDALNSRQVEQSLQVLHAVLQQAGPLRLETRRERWQAADQDTGSPLTVELPVLSIGGREFGQVRSLNSPVLVVDEVLRVTGMSCSIFQRMNAKGDMLRIASSVVSKDQTRSVGLYFPAVSASGEPNEVISRVLSGQNFIGAAFVWDTFNITGYIPLRDPAGNIIGMGGMGIRFKEMEALRKAIMDIRVGKTGYVSVSGGKGRSKGHYIISKEGKRDGENIWETRDSDGRLFIQDIHRQALAQPPGVIAYSRYFWQNTGEPAPRAKIAAFTYFPQWDWLIVAGTYEDDYDPARQKVEGVILDLLLKSALAGIAAMVVAILLALFLVNRLTRPIGLLTRTAEKIATGEIHAAKAELGSAARTLTPSSAGRFIQQMDETDLLLDDFLKMTVSLDSLIGQVQRSGIQVTTSATEIAASARQLEATMTEQAASTRQVMATSKEISNTSEDLVHDMDEVAGVVGNTASMAETGRTGLTQMETAMRQLMTATGSISAKLAVINDKTTKISSVVTAINKISDQTNLLSLNATIEAEKAGEFGRGFSVVAREISRLADQTAIATQDIEYMVREMQSSVAAGVMEMDKFADEVRGGMDRVAAIGGQLAGIIDQVRALGPRFETVAGSAHGQSSGAQQISEAMDQLATTADQIKESLHEFKKATDQLNLAVQSLQGEVSRFRISS